MSNEVKLLLQISIIILQFYVGLVLLLTPEKAHIGHYIVVMFISIPILVEYVRRNINK